jgi:glycosyltransferase involved in cell wall biosynthesis
MRKKILFILSYLPYKNVPHAGGRFTYHWLEHLRKHSDLYAVAFIGSKKEMERLEDAQAPFASFESVSLSPAKKCFHAFLFFFLPLRFAFRCSFSFVRKILSFRDNEFNAIILDHSILGVYAFFLRLLFPKTRIIWNMHELSSLAKTREIKHSNLIKKLYLAMEHFKSAFWEKNISKVCNVVLTFSEEEKKMLLRMGCPKEKIYVVQPHVYNLNHDGENRFIADPSSIIFFGKMSRVENWEAARYFIDEILPLIKKYFPRVGFYVVGADPPSKLLELSRNNANVFVTGYVHNIEEYLPEIKVAVFPLRLGAGLRFKILDALAWGIPVVTTSIGVEGIPVHSDIIKVADSPEEIAKKVLYFLKMSNKDINELSPKAVKFVRENYDWEQNCINIDKILSSCDEIN